jgi:glycosyltransferase involved in cell wall biosynthesis
VNPPPTLDLQLESELPAELGIGAGTAVFVAGRVFCPAARVVSLEFVLDGEAQPVAAHSMPRLDPLRMLHPDLDPFAGHVSDPDSDADPWLHSYRSGFWGTVRIGPRPAGAVIELGLRATLAGGDVVETALARITATAPPTPAAVPPTPAAAPAADAGGPRVAICLASYNPPSDLLARQLASIRAQTHRNWICLISDDCSSPERYSELTRAVGDDPRFVLSRAPRRLGFYGNFERALGLVPADVDYVALSDQDDEWHPDKLSALLDAIGEAQLVYSDARVVSRDGEVRSETWWTVRPNNHTDLLALLVANSVTGAASLFRRDLLEHALPFPPAQFTHYHDHWLALVALAKGEVAYVSRPLYDYVQHGSASLGHARANRTVTLRERILRRPALHERIRMWRLHYFADVCRLRQFATVLELRLGPQISRRKRRRLGRVLAAEHSLPALARLGLRGARGLADTARSPTLGAEWMVFCALAWRRLLALTARDIPQRHLRLDALPPPSLIESPGVEGLDPSARELADKIAPLRFVASDGAPRRVNLLLPTIDLDHFFGGYITKLNLALHLIGQGMRVRLVTVDPVGPLPSGWRSALAAYADVEAPFEQLEIVFGREAAAIEVSREDSFIATTWWTAHIAADALGVTGAERFVYLIQEYEPFTFAMGAYAALAAQSYEFPHFALFSTELLRDYFRIHRIGVFASGKASGERSSVSFENTIAPVRSPSVDELAGRTPGRLLFYARPEPHASRNMFELGVLALARALTDGVFADGWELYGIGTVARRRQISLGSTTTLELLPRSDPASYVELLHRCDVGLALMYTPHPSLVPIEMAAAGMLTVTNTFGNKTPDALAAISSNLIGADPTVGGIAAALAEAVAGAGELERRVRGSDVRWSRNWDQAFRSDVLAPVLAVLEESTVAKV